MKALFKIFVVTVLLIAVIVASISIYMNFYGKRLLESKLSDMLGTKLKFKSFSLRLDKSRVDFRGITIPSEIDFESKNIFNAEKFTLILDRYKFDKEKKLAIDEIIVEKAVFNIERNKNGIFNIASIGSRANSGGGLGVAYAGEPGANYPIPMYNFAKNVKRILIKKSTINFRDYYISREPLAISCVNFYADVKMTPESDTPQGGIPMKYEVSFEVPRKNSRSEFFLRGNAAIHQDRVDTEAVIDTKNVDIMQFLPYFKNNTPFIFYEGEFNSTTTVALHNHTLNSLTTMIFRRLKLDVDPQKSNSSFLQVSINELVPYLTSGSGELIFDFEVKGPMNNPQVGIGPNVRMAIGAAVVNEVGKFIQQMQNIYGK